MKKKAKRTTARRRAKASGERGARRPLPSEPGSPAEALDAELTLVDRSVMGPPLSQEERECFGQPVRFDPPGPFEVTEELRTELAALETELGMPGLTEQFLAFGNNLPMVGRDLIPKELRVGFIERYPKLSAMLRFEIEDDGGTYDGNPVFPTSRDLLRGGYVPGSRHDQDLKLREALAGPNGNMLAQVLPTVAGQLAAYFEPSHPGVEVEQMTAGGIFAGQVGFAYYDLGDDRRAITRIFALAAAFAAKNKQEFERMVKLARGEFFTKKKKAKR